MIRTCLGLASVVLFPGVVLAQAATIQDAQPQSQRALQDFQTQGQGFNQSGGINLNELIHRANLVNRRTTAEFQEEQDQSLNDAVEAFRKQQRLRRANP